MSQDNEKDEPSVDEILSSIKDVIASDKDVSNNEEDNDVVDDNVFELTDIIDEQCRRRFDGGASIVRRDGF